MTYIIIPLFVILLASMIANLKMYRKIARYEEWIIQFERAVGSAKETLDAVDNAAWFESDDIVGHAFKTIHNIIEQLNTIFYEQNNTES